MKSTLLRRYRHPIQYPMDIIIMGTSLRILTSLYLTNVRETDLFFLHQILVAYAAI